MSNVYASHGTYFFLTTHITNYNQLSS